MKRVYNSPTGHNSQSGPSARRLKKTQRPRCQICQEPFDTLLFAVSVRQGKAHPLCAGLKAIGLEKLATTSGR
ncbi:MAG: hypothetical protein AAGB01_10685 [Cyanobacteria bacterium P01_F01_bin.42]